MKINSKLFVFVFTLALGTGGSIALAQSNPPKVNTPNPVPVVIPMHSASGTTSPTAGLRRGAPGQPNMERAYIALQEAKRALEDGAPDKGGFREKAIASVDQAIKDVGAAVEYARTHAEEARGPRSTAPRASASNRGVTTSTTSMPGGVAPSGQTPGGVFPSGLTPGQK